MGQYLGVRPRASVVPVAFHTSLATGAASAFSATLETADFDIYKGYTETQRSSSNGYTLDEAIDAVTGLSALSVDMSDNSDAGYWITDGGLCRVAISPDETLDGVTIAAWLDSWDLETHASYSTRLYLEKKYPSATGPVIATTTNNSTTSINLTDIIDAQTVIVPGQKLEWWDTTDGSWHTAIVTSFAYPQATVVNASDGTSAMGATVAAGDMVWVGDNVNVNVVRFGNVANSAWSATRGTAGTALPAAAANAAGGLPISDAGGLDIDTFLGRITGDVALASVLSTHDTAIKALLPSALVGGRIDATVDGTGMEAGAIDAIIDEVIEGSTTLRQMMRLFASALLGKASGLDANAPVFRDIGDTKDRITATTDADGNRTAVTLDAS